MKSTTIISTKKIKRINYDSLFNFRKVRRPENQVQKLKAWILRNVDPGGISVNEKLELYRLLTL